MDLFLHVGSVDTAVAESSVVGGNNGAVGDNWRRSSISLVSWSGITEAVVGRSSIIVDRVGGRGIGDTSERLRDHSHEGEKSVLLNKFGGGD